ncbi:MAG: LytTR family DNA-binding domain-containing protein [Bacillota bacterium]|jgi:DNA-binding LytR/AlgR family response regulator|nr:LytTR family DNA-binding domain-containing protein [Bacillota bacterium]
MINIAICDDEKRICSEIENIILKYNNKNNLNIDIEIFCSGEELLNYIEKGNKFDLIYLDIELGEIDGIEVGNHLRKILRDYTTEIVYISGKDEYYRQLFDVQPLHFIPKPIDPDIVIKDLELAIERSKKLNYFFKYQKENKFIKISMKDIIYFESLNREIKITCVEGVDYFYGTLKDVLSKTNGFPFIKIHRSYIINYNHCVRFKYSEVSMSDGTTLPISRTKRKEIQDIQLKEE